MGNIGWHLNERGQILIEAIMVTILILGMMSAFSLIAQHQKQISKKLQRSFASSQLSLEATTVLKGEVFGKSNE